MNRVDEFIKFKRVENILEKANLDIMDKRMAIHIILSDIVEELELYKGNYNTCLEVLKEHDPKLKEYLESRIKEK